MRKRKFHSKAWRDFHLRQIENIAGPRYSPKWNVETSVTPYIDGLSRNTRFYDTIKGHYGEIQRGIIHLPQEINNKDISHITAKYYKVQKEILKLLKITKEYNTLPIPCNKIEKQSTLGQKFLSELSTKLREERESILKNQAIVPTPAPVNGISYNDRIELSIQDIRKISNILYSLSKFIRGLSVTFANTQQVLITGESGIGKTHLLCDIVRDRFRQNPPLGTLLVFGEKFAGDSEPFQQIAQQIGLKPNSKNAKKILEKLNTIGEKSKSRSLLIIDALNETKIKGFWRRYLKTITAEVKKHPHVGLIISVRNGYEDIVLTKQDRKQFQSFEHSGFRDREWEAVTKFFQEFNLPLPEIPLLYPEFQHPLFLLLFCKAFSSRSKKKNKQIFRGHEGATYIFEHFVKETAKKIAKSLNVRGGKDSKNSFIWDTVIEKVAEKMVSTNNDRVAEVDVRGIIAKAHPDIDTNTLLHELDRNLLLVKVINWDNGEKSFDYKFPFQKFSDHLIGRFIFKKCRNSGKSPEHFFEKTSPIGKLIATRWNIGLIEALSIQCPEMYHGLEFFEVANFIDESQLGAAFVESLIWRRVDAFSTDIEKLINYINKYTSLRADNNSHVLNSLLTIAPITTHPFNANFLHRNLMDQPMSKRDAWWSTYLHRQYGEYGPIDRLITWAWAPYDRKGTSDEIIKLCATTIIWFFTSSNRIIRDRATKALVALLTSHLAVIVSLLEDFKGVDDLYVLDRLYAVAYGCILRNKDDRTNAKELAMWVYKNFFEKDTIAHILIRDYARGIMEVAKNREFVKFPDEKILPPFKSQWPNNIPTEEYLKKRYWEKENDGKLDYYSIWSSVMYNSTQFPGDFGKYEINTALEHWSGEKFKGHKANSTTKSSNHFNTSIGQQWIFNRVIQLGWNPKTHGEFEKNMNYGNRHSEGGRNERIGKKYQWIALHEFLALVSDHYKYRKDSWSDNASEYIGPWQVYMRDIDPSLTLQEAKDKAIMEVPRFKSRIPQNLNWDKLPPLQDWLSLANRNLPNLKSLIEIVDSDGTEWLLLKGNFDWDEENSPEEEKYSSSKKKLWYHINGYIVKKKEQEALFNWAKHQDFFGRWMPESDNINDTFIGEYPNSLAFSYYNTPFYHRSGWSNSGRMGEDIIPVEILITDDYYHGKKSSRDGSIEDSLSIHIPSKWLVENMNLSQKYTDGSFYNSDDILVAFDPSVYNKEMSGCLLVRKSILLSFLENNECSIVWTILGEKQVIGGYNYQPQKGFPVLNGAFTFNNSNNIIGSKRWKFPYIKKDKKVNNKLKIKVVRV